MGSDSSPMKPAPIPTRDEDSPDPAAVLLSFNTNSSNSSAFTQPNPHHHKPATTVIFISILLVTCTALSAAAAFAFLFFSAPSTAAPTHNSSAFESKAQPLRKLDRPVVLLVSSDGFRFGYQFKTPTPNIGRLIANGTEAEQGLIHLIRSYPYPSLLNFSADASSRS